MPADLGFRALRGHALLGLGYLAFAFFVLFPIVWIFLMSLKSFGDIIAYPPRFLFTPTLENYVEVLFGGEAERAAGEMPDLLRFLMNSVIISGGAVLVYHKAGCAYRRRFEQWLESRHIVPAHVLEFASYHGMLAAAAGGVGLGLLPRSVLEVFPQKNVLSTRDIAPRLARLKTFLVMPRDRHQSSLARLEECLREDAAKQRGGEGRGSAKAARPKVASAAR